MWYLSCEGEKFAMLEGIPFQPHSLIPITCQPLQDFSLQSVLRKQGRDPQTSMALMIPLNPQGEASSYSTTFNRSRHSWDGCSPEVS